MPLPQPPSMDDATEDASLEDFEGSVQDEQFDREALEDKVGDMLAKLDDDGEDDIEEDDIEDADDEDESDDEVEGDEEADENDEIEDDGTSDNEEEEESEAAAEPVALNDDAPTLPDAFRRSLVAYGYTDAEINRDLNKHGPAFVSTAAGIHSQRNQELAAWSAAGRAARDGDNVSHPANDQSAELQKLDVDALKAEFGDDEMIDRIVGRINPIIDRVTAMVPGIEKVQTDAKEQANAQLRKTVEGFFVSDDIASRYSTVYGDGNKTLNEPQLLNRQRVLEEADALVTGAQLQGRNLTVEQALQNAHDMVSHEFVQQATRKSIKKEAKTRNRGISQKPANRGKSKTKYVGPARTRDELYDRTDQRLKAVFGD